MTHIVIIDALIVVSWVLWFKSGFRRGVKAGYEQGIKEALAIVKKNA